MSAGPIYNFSGEFAWASNFDESVLALEPDLIMQNVPVPTAPAWNTPEGHVEIARITAEVDGLVPRVIEEGLLMVPGVERPYQAWKTDDVKAAAYILGASTPAAAKKFGQPPTKKGGIVHDLRPGWVTGVAQSAMLYLERLKFSEERLAQLLKGTGFRLMVEGNNWNDTIWGAIWMAANAEANGLPGWGRDGNKVLRGLNWLGRLLMLVRAEHNCGMQRV